MNKELIDRAWRVLPAEFLEEVKKEYYDCKHCNADACAIELEVVFGIHNLTSDAEPEEMLTCEKRKVMKLYNKFQKDDSFTGLYAASVLDTLFGSKCLPDEVCNVASSDVASNVASSKPKPVEPKYHVGQKVKFKDKDFGFEITAVEKWDDCDEYMYKLAGWKHSYRESDLEHYTEPDTSHEKPVCENHSDNTSQKEVNVNSNRNHRQFIVNYDKQFDNILKDSFREHNRLHIAAMAMQGMLSNTTRFSSYEISDLVRISLNCADALIAESEKEGES